MFEQSRLSRKSSTEKLKKTEKLSNELYVMSICLAKLYERVLKIP
jgi:hypothetical protein